MSPTMQSCSMTEESYCAPWDLQIQEEKLKFLNQQHQRSSLSASTTLSDTLFHPSHINYQTSINHTNTPFHRTYSVRTPTKKQLFTSCVSSTSVLPSSLSRGINVSHQNDTVNNKSIMKNIDPTLKKISNCLSSHTIRAGTTTSRSFLFTSTSPKKINTSVDQHVSQPMSFGTALLRFKCLSSSIHNNSLSKKLKSDEQSWDKLPTSYLNNHHGRSLQKLPNTEETKRHCLSPTFPSSQQQSEDITILPIDRYFWYHFSMSRRQAENILESRSPGSFLVRQSESGNQNDYSLSIKTIKGCMHMRICYSRGFYILGECSRPFSSVAYMIKYFSQTSVPVRGAAHIKLGTPVLRCELLLSSLSNEELL
ncbi:unnamed protein product [Adineta steineri]|uniref:SH2 domain-containing protein n=2 Tax=Adineta steineri TaxID=433720 RepID=A0A818L3D9_9BILA|nr:unnamed protein product [Adineta steineri]CAF3560310.1 unnamed protein product [Adineta steineri]